MNILELLGFTKKRDSDEERRLLKMTTANEFINVTDVRGSILYSRDGMVYAYLKIQPICLDLLSQHEKDRKIRTFAAEFSAERKPIKFLSNSRPVDISGMSEKLSRLLAEADDPVMRELLNSEIMEISKIALTAEITERQCFLILWERSGAEGEHELLKRATEIKNRFSACDIHSEICGQGAIVRMLNLFANPNSAHFENGDITPTIPFLAGYIR